MDELVDILDSNGVATGEVCLKSEAHKKGLMHPCIHVWIYTKRGHILIQKRIEEKDTYPGLWDVSVAGHIGAGENPLLAAKREVFEEVGYDTPIDSLNFIGSHKTYVKHKKNLIDYEFHYIYIVELIIPFEKLSIQIDEVSELKLISIDDLLRVFSKEVRLSEYVPYDQDYLKMVFDAVYKNILKK